MVLLAALSSNAAFSVCIRFKESGAFGRTPIRLALTALNQTSLRRAAPRYFFQLDHNARSCLSVVCSGEEEDGRALGR